MYCMIFPVALAGEDLEHSEETELVHVRQIIMFFKAKLKRKKNKGTDMQLPSNMSLFFYKSFLQNWNLFYLICDLYKSLLLITR